MLTDGEIGELGDYDSVNVILRTPSGRQAVITNSRRATYGYDQRMRCWVPRAWWPRQPQREPITLADATAFTRAAAQLLHDALHRRLCQRNRSLHRAVVDGKPTPTTGHDGLMALALAEAALKSVAEGRLVKVSEVL